MSKGAIIDGEYRYLLWRELDEKERPRKSLLWIMLNPSTADAERDDATIRKVCGFSRRWGFNEVRITNLYALRSRDPKALKTHPEPIGPLNDEHLRYELSLTDNVVLAWGAHADVHRAKKVSDMARLASPSRVWHLGLTGSGQPKHPLMLGYDTERHFVKGEIR